MDFFVSLYFYVIISFGITDLLAYVFFHLKFTDDIIELLHQEGFVELSKKLHQIKTTMGKLPVQGTNNIESFYNAWKEFRSLAIPAETNKLFMLHRFYKIIIKMTLIYIIIFILPIIIFIGYAGVTDPKIP